MYFGGRLASVIRKTPEYLNGVLEHHTDLEEGAPPVQSMITKKKMPVEWTRLVKTFVAVRAKRQPGGEYTRVKKRGPPNLTLFPLQVAVRIVQHCEKDVDAEALQAVLPFWDKVRPAQVLPEEEEEEEGKHRDPEVTGIRSEDRGNIQDRPVQVLVPGRMKREPASFLQFPTIMRGNRIIIDLIRVGDEGRDNVDALQAQLADNFLAPPPTSTCRLSPQADLPSVRRTYIQNAQGAVYSCLSAKWLSPWGDSSCPPGGTDLP
jgi:hypothetical protein